MFTLCEFTHYLQYVSRILNEFKTRNSAPVGNIIDSFGWVIFWSFQRKLLLIRSTLGGMKNVCLQLLQVMKTHLSNRSTLEILYFTN